MKSIYIFLLLVFTSFPSFANGLEVQNNISVSAAIEDNRVTIYGFSSPESRIELTSINTFAATYSDAVGSFTFDRLILPKHPGELCLTATDDNNRKTVPVCIPQPPVTNYFTNIGPILLPPTITINDPVIKPNSTAIGSGQGIPNTTINIFVYQVTDRPPLFPRPASAFALPSISVPSDINGNFSFNLPTAYSSKYRLFASTNLNDLQSPKSNTLTYNLPSVYWIFILENGWLLYVLPIFLVSLFLLFIFTTLYYRSRHIHHLTNSGQSKLVKIKT